VADQVSQASPFGTTDTVISATRTKPVRERVAVDPEVALKAGLAVVGIVVLAAGYVMRTRTKRQLRKPTVRQKEAIAEPLSRILVRRLDMGRDDPKGSVLVLAGHADNRRVGLSRFLGRFI